MIHGDPACGRIYGARNVKKIDLWNCAAGRLDTVLISGDLGESFGVVVDHLDKAVTVGGELLGGISASTSSGNISIAGDAHGGMSITTIAGAITIGGNLLNSITATSLANLTVNGSGPHTGNITVRGNYAKAVLLNGSYAGRMSFNDSLSGQVTIGADLTGSISIAAR